MTHQLNAPLRRAWSVLAARRDHQVPTVADATGMDADAMFGRPEPRRYEPPPPPQPNALLAKAARECARCIESAADTDRARAATLDAFAAMIDLACRDERARLDAMADTLRRAGL